jgi:hypothetical protein
MPALTIGFAVALALLGLGGFFATGSSHITALIPTFFGAGLLVLGLIALRGGAIRKHAMHLAALLGLLGVFGGIGRSAPKLGAVLSGQPVEPSATAIWLQFSFGVICLIFLATCVRSFIQARLAARQNSLQS